MTSDPLKVLGFYREIAENAADGLARLDREDLLAVHKALVTLKDEVEQLLLSVPPEASSSKIALAFAPHP